MQSFQFKNIMINNLVKIFDKKRIKKYNIMDLKIVVNIDNLCSHL